MRTTLFVCVGGDLLSRYLSKKIIIFFQHIVQDLNEIRKDGVQ
jgi:hypothetical protein